MRISKTPNVTPDSTPPSCKDRRVGAGAQAWDEQVIWASLVPRLVHPSKLAIVEALIEAGKPLSVEDLISLLPEGDGNEELIRYHANSMVEAGALEISAQGEGASAVSRFYFPLPS